MTNPQHQASLAPPTFATSIPVSPEYIRLPRPGEFDPMFGLTRSYLNLLILPTKENGQKPFVRSSVIRQPGTKTGVRLINVASLRAYLRSRLRPDADLDSGNSPVAETTQPIQPPNSHVEFIRLPRAKERDPLFGLSRSFLNNLVLACEANSFRPQVQSHLLRRRGYRTGIRLVSVDSLRAYVKAHEESATPKAENPS